MAFTDHCNVYGAIHEDGFNKIIQHLMRQRPSLFNYGSQYFASNPNRLCQKIDAHPEVIRRSNPLVSLEDLLPIPGTGGLYGMDFCVQLTKAQIDFHPGNAINLPPELDPLGRQRAALSAYFCVGLVCPEPRAADYVGDLVAATDTPKDVKDEARDEPRPPIRPIPSERVICFCLEVYAVLHFDRISVNGMEYIVLRLDGFEIVDILPNDLESGLECYVATILRVGILPKIRIAVDTMIFEVGGILNLSAGLTPISNDVPDNPAIEEDQVKIFVDLGIS